MFETTRAKERKDVPYVPLRHVLMRNGTFSLVALEQILDHLVIFRDHEADLSAPIESDSL